MTVDDLIEQLKHCLNEPSGLDTDQFSRPQLILLLNRGFAYLQGKMVAVKADSVKAADTIGVTALKNLYPMPPGCYRVLDVTRTFDGRGLNERSDAWMNVTFGRLVGDNVNAAAVATAERPSEWAPYGRYIRVGATPTLTEANGLQIGYVPSLALPANDPNYVPSISDGLLDIVVNKAWGLGLRPSADISQHAAASKALESSLSNFDALVSPGGGAIQLLPDFDPVDGFYGDTEADEATR